MPAGGVCAVSEAWPFIEIAADGTGPNGVTIPVKHVVFVGETPDGAGCRVSMVGGHCIALGNISRERFTRMMEKVLNRECVQ